MAEFLEGLEQFCSQSDEDKVRCLFQIYDENGKFSFDCIYLSSIEYSIYKRSWFVFSGDGLIKLSELKAVLKACMKTPGVPVIRQVIRIVWLKTDSPTKI